MGGLLYPKKLHKATGAFTSILSSLYAYVDLGLLYVLVLFSPTQRKGGSVSPILSNKSSVFN